MPKRTRDDEMKPTQPISALAARRLAQQQPPQQSATKQDPKSRDLTSSATPAHKGHQTFPNSDDAPLRSPANQHQDDATLERERLEFRRKREEIEEQLKMRNKEINVRRKSGTIAGLAPAATNPTEAIGGEPLKKKAKREAGGHGKNTDELSTVQYVKVLDELEKEPPKKKNQGGVETETTVSEVEEMEAMTRSQLVDGAVHKKARKEKRREESALERMKREKAEEAERLATISDVDVVMQSPGDSEMELEDEKETDESTVPQVHQISSFIQTTETCTVNGKHATFRMVRGETLVIVGVYQVKVLKGSITLSGSTMIPSSPPRNVYAPTTHALPVIEAITTGFTSSDIPKASKSKSPEYDVEITLTSTHSSILDISKLCPTYSNIWSIPTAPTSRFTGLSFKPVYSSSSNIAALNIPPSWKSTFDALISDDDSDYDPPRILVAGSKGTGKSTLSRVLANHCLSSCPAVAYLDVDPGQPTFSPPGLLSLHILTSPVHGPPFTISALPAIRSHHIGYITPRTDPGHYIACISDLVETHRDRYPDIPLIINTAGWTKGLGLELLQDILNISGATDIISLSSPHHQNPLAELVIPEQSCTHHELHSVAPKESRFSAPDFRALQTMCYFHYTTEGEWNFERPLTGIKPWRVPYHGDEKGIDALCILGEQIPPDMISTALDSTVVGVVIVDPAAFPTDRVLEEPPYPPMLDSDLHPSPAVSECKGLAVIRVIDTENGEVQVITNIDASEMERWDKEGLKVVLVRGRVELPVWDMIVRGRERDPGPFLEMAGGQRGKGGAVWKVRRNVMRRGQQGGR